MLDPMMTTDPPSDAVPPSPGAHRADDGAQAAADGGGPLDPVPYDPRLDDLAGIPAEQVIQQKQSRAGGKLPGEIGVGLGLGVVIVSTLLIRKESFLPVIAVAVGIGLWELRAALRHAAVEAPLVPPLLGTAAMVWAAYVHGPAGLVVGGADSCPTRKLW